MLNQIKNLEIYCGEEDGNANAVLLAMDKLSENLNYAQNAELTRGELSDYMLSDHDVLDNIDGVSDAFREDVREIQHAIINYYGIE